jgi:hypothetical protein
MKFLSKISPPNANAVKLYQYGLLKLAHVLIQLSKMIIRREQLEDKGVIGG